LGTWRQKKAFVSQTKLSTEKVNPIILYKFVTVVNFIHDNALAVHCHEVYLIYTTGVGGTNC
jgi:hypothetical protein